MRVQQTGWRDNGYAYDAQKSGNDMVQAQGLLYTKHLPSQGEV